MGRLCWRLTAVFLLAATAAFGAVFSTVRGVVHDPQHRPIPGATVTLQAVNADWMSTTGTDTNGEFQIATVPLGEYTLTVSMPGFVTAEQRITVVSDASPVLHVQLDLASVSQSVTVSARPEEVPNASMTPTTTVTRADIEHTPGADRTNGLDAFTAFIPGAYVTHDQLHMRGGHQVTWLIDGVPVPNTNIASNVGPQFDPKDIDVLEVQRGSYGAEYGDRTYGVFNVVPRSGFERENEAELVVTGGSFYQTNDQGSVGGHTERFAYFVSGNGNRSDLGLGTPGTDVLHDRESGGGVFASLFFNASPSNQLRVVTSLRRDRYEIPNTPEAQETGVDDVERESDAFVNMSWVRTFHSGALLTISPFYHFNAADFDGGAGDVPVSTTDERSSHYGGLQATFSATLARRHQVQVGFYGFHQQDHQRVGLVFNDSSESDLSVRTEPSGKTTAWFAQDDVMATSWLTVTGGIRYTRFSGGVAEHAASPRAGVTVRIPGVDATARAFYGRFYQEPPLVTASGPLVDFVTSQDLALIPLHGERDEEYQVGLTLPVRGWMLDLDRFRTRATNFFDHNPVGNSNIFFPVTIDGALIRGTEVTVRSPRRWTRGEIRAAYSYQRAEGHGALTGGLTDFPDDNGTFALDHDQRHTLSITGNVLMPRQTFASATVSYGSGFPDDDSPSYLPGHTAVNLSAGKSFTQKLSLSITALNVTNRHVLIDNSLTFGGTHFNNPREIYGEIRWRFHY